MLPHPSLWRNTGDGERMGDRTMENMAATATMTAMGDSVGDMAMAASGGALAARAWPAECTRAGGARKSGAPLPCPS